MQARAQYWDTHGRVGKANVPDYQTITYFSKCFSGNGGLSTYPCHFERAKRVEKSIGTPGAGQGAWGKKRIN